MGYEVPDETQRQMLTYFSYVMFGIAGVYLILVCCLRKKIQLAIAINKVAAQFVHQTKPVIFVPLVQVLIAMVWWAVWMLVASYLVSQVPDDYTPTQAYVSYA